MVADQTNADTIITVFWRPDGSCAVVWYNRQQKTSWWRGFWYPGRNSWLVPAPSCCWDRKEWIGRDLMTLLYLWYSDQLPACVIRTLAHRVDIVNGGRESLVTMWYRYMMFCMLNLRDNAPTMGVYFGRWGGHRSHSSQDKEKHIAYCIPFSGDYFIPIGLPHSPHELTRVHDTNASSDARIRFGKY